MDTNGKSFPIVGYNWERLSPLWEPTWKINFYCGIQMGKLSLIMHGYNWEKNPHCGVQLGKIILNVGTNWEKIFFIVGYNWEKLAP